MAPKFTAIIVGSFKQRHRQRGGIISFRQNLILPVKTLIFILIIFKPAFSTENSIKSGNKQVQIEALAHSLLISHPIWSEKLFSVPDPNNVSSQEPRFWLMHLYCMERFIYGSNRMHQSFPLLPNLVVLTVASTVILFIVMMKDEYHDYGVLIKQ